MIFLRWIKNERCFPFMCSFKGYQDAPVPRVQASERKEWNFPNKDLLCHGAKYELEPNLFDCSAALCKKAVKEPTSQLDFV